MNEFDEQTDFSFLSISAPAAEVSKKYKSRKALAINANDISVKAITPDIGKWNVGRKHSVEHRAKLTAVNTGRKLSGQALDNVLAGHKKRNTTRSAECIAKISKAQKGRKYETGTRGGNFKNPIMTPIGEFRCPSEAAKAYGITKWWMCWLTRTDERIGKGFYFIKGNV